MKQKKKKFLKKRLTKMTVHDRMSTVAAESDKLKNVEHLEKYPSG